MTLSTESIVTEEARRRLRFSPVPRRAGRSRLAGASVVIWAYAVISLYPLLWLVMQSFRTDAQILGDPFGVPLNPSLDAYATAFSATPFIHYFLNSLLVTLAVVLVSVGCATAAGYAFSRLRFPGSTLLFALFLGVLVVPAPVLLLPVFLISGDLGILNSYIGLIGPYSAGVLPLGVYLAKVHFDSIPDSFVEAAIIDRASSWQIFRLVMLPLIGPAAATIAALAFMSAWNEYIYALVALSDANLYTLPIGVADLAGKQFLYGKAPTFAAMVITALPVFIVFALAQRTFVSSLTIGGGVKQ